MISTTKDAYQLLHDGALALSQIEGNGIRIDQDYLTSASQEIGEQMTKLENKLKDSKVFRRWSRRFGTKTKLGNKGQLADVVFNLYGYKRPDRFTSSSTEDEERYASDELTFEGVDLPFVKTYFKLEKLKKLRGTYLKGIQREVQNGYLHAFYNLHIARSWRSSSSEPNFQNIPIRNPEMSKWIRSAFIARKNHVLVEIDFSGIEVKIAACYHKDPVLIKDILHGDMHRDTAASCYLLGKSEVTKDVRYCSKNKFVFPQFYGSYYVDCARSLWNALDQMQLKGPSGKSLKEHLATKGIRSLGSCDPTKKPVKGTFEDHIRKVESAFWERYHVYDKWKRTWWRRYQEQGYFDLKTGFRATGIYKRNECINIPIQGSAFHCELWCLIELQRWLRSVKWRSKIVGQIHDSTVVDVHVDELQGFLNHSEEVMTKGLPKAWKWITVPIEVEVEVCPRGGSWYDKTPWVKNAKGIWGPKAA